MANGLYRIQCSHGMDAITTLNPIQANGCDK